MRSSPYIEAGKVVDGLVGELGIELRADLLLDPGVSQGVDGRQALLGVLHQQAPDEILCLFADVAPDLAAELPVALLDLVDDLFIASVEGGHSAEHDVQNDTNAPQVTLLGVLFE